MADTSIDTSSSPIQEADKSQLLEESFVDEALVQEMMKEGIFQTRPAKDVQIAISSCEDDFAGWNLPAKFSYPEPARKSA